MSTPSASKSHHKHASKLRRSPWANMVQDKPESEASTSLACWENKNELHKREFGIRRVDVENAAAAATALRDTGGRVTVVFRLLNEPRLLDSLVAVMWQLPGDGTKWWMPVWRDLSDALTDVVDALLEADLVVLNLSLFREATFNCLGKRPKTKELSRGTIKGGRGNQLRRIGNEQGIVPCFASFYRPIESESDFDECYVFHMAMELDLMVTR